MERQLIESCYCWVIPKFKVFMCMELIHKPFNHAHAEMGETLVYFDPHYETKKILQHRFNLYMVRPMKYFGIDLVGALFGSQAT
jgi:hypothetical protein